MTRQNPAMAGKHNNKKETIMEMEQENPQDPELDRLYNFLDLEKTEHPAPITDVHVHLIGEDGNAFFILGKVKEALKNAGYDERFVKDFVEEATSGNYEHLLQTVQTYVHVE